VETQVALKEMESVHRQYLREAWATYAPIAGVTYYETAPFAGEPGKGPKDGSALVAPVTLRGEEIGTLGVQDDSGTRQWTTEEVALTQAVTDRLALAAENLRLLDETRRRAAQEQLVGEVTTRMRQTLDVDVVLDTAVNEIARVMGLAALDLRLGMTMPEKRSPVATPPVPSGKGKRREKTTGPAPVPRKRQGKRQDGNSE